MSYGIKMIQSNAAMQEPFIAAEDEKPKKQKKWQIGGLMDTSSEEASKEPSPQTESDLNIEKIEKTFAQKPLGLPTTDNFENSGKGSETSNGMKASSEEKDED